MNNTTIDFDYLNLHRDTAVRHLLAWFAAQSRDLPWRHKRTPYRVWVSEVMLQQTQVETVRDYYVRFMERFPSVSVLAESPLEDVLKLWEGLGYYSRARSLHKAARQLLRDFDGDLPRDVQALQGLPGIGTYTAGAIASIAFDIPAPAVDGNVTRVFARLLALERPSAKELAAAVRVWMPETSPGVFSEALMELGAQVCRPRSPHCDLCPWRDFCKARQLDAVEIYPVPKVRKKIPHYDVVAAVTWREDQRFLVAQRRPEDMLGGMWEFPGGKCEAGELLPQALRRELQEEMAIDLAVGEQLTVVKHAYTHFRITLYAFLCRLMAGTPQCIECADFRWATLTEIAELPMAVTDRKIAQALASAVAAAPTSFVVL